MADRTVTRRSFLLSAAAGAATLGSGTLLSGCASGEAATTFDQARESGRIKIGFANEAPYGFTDDNGKLTGQGPEVARAVLAELGIDEIEGVLVDFRQLIPGLKANNFAFVAAGQAISPDRCADASFSIPDYQVESAFLVPKGNPEGINRFEDITNTDALIAVLSGGVELDQAVSAGVAEEQIVTLGDQDSMFRAVRDQRVYGAATLDTTVAYLLKQNPNSGLVKSEPFSPDEPVIGAFTFPKGDSAFLDEFNRELTKLKESERWLEIVEPFGFTSDHVPPEDVTTEELCEG